MQKRPVRYRGAALLFLALSAILLWLLAGYAAAENRELYLTPLPADARGWEKKSPCRRRRSRQAGKRSTSPACWSRPGRRKATPF